MEINTSGYNYTTITGTKAIDLASKYNNSKVIDFYEIKETKNNLLEYKKYAVYHKGSSYVFVMKEDTYEKVTKYVGYVFKVLFFLPYMIYCLAKNISDDDLHTMPKPKTKITNSDIKNAFYMIEYANVVDSESIIIDREKEIVNNEVDPSETMNTTIHNNEDKIKIDTIISYGKISEVEKELYNMINKNCFSGSKFF